MAAVKQLYPSQWRGLRCAQVRSLSFCGVALSQGRAMIAGPTRRSPASNSPLTPRALPNGPQSPNQSFSYNAPRQWYSSNSYQPYPGTYGPVQNGAAPTQPPMPQQQTTPPHPQMPPPQQQSQSQQQPPVPFQAAPQGPPVMPPQTHHLPHQQPPAAPAPGQQPPAAPEGGQADAGPKRVNPGQTAINSVTLLGTLVQPRVQGRTPYAVLQVPYATREGHEEFMVSAWGKRQADQLVNLAGAQVVLEGRLSHDKEIGGIVVVPYNIKLVDTSLPPSSSSAKPPRRTRSSSAAQAPPGKGGDDGLARPAVKNQELWQTHYETQTRSVQDLSAKFSLQPRTVLDKLLLHAFQTNSPLRWRVLAEEAGLGGGPEAFTLEDFMAMVADYRAEVAAAQAAAQPGAEPPPLPVAKDGRLKVRPIRDWALTKDPQNPHHYTVSTLQSQHGEGLLYIVLQMAVVADATKGAWDYEAEFGVHG